MASIFVELNQLSEDDFIGTVNEGKLTIRLKPKTVRSSIKSYATNVPSTRLITFMDTRDDRRKLQVKDGFGILHLDFTSRVATDTSGSWKLPDNSPVPISVIEAQTYSGGTVWIDTGTRTINWSGLTSGRRYVINLTGFWEYPQI